MKKITKRVATYMLAIAGLTTVFTSCNEENDEVMNRKANYKSSISSGSNPYAFYEDNNFSDESIFQMTAEFSRQMRTNTVTDMDISQVVVVLETYWNYGIVPNQPYLANTNSPEREFLLTVPLHNGAVDGNALRTNLLNLIMQIKQVANGQALNMADVSVVALTEGDVVFKFYLPEIIGNIDMEPLLTPYSTYVMNLDTSMTYSNLAYGDTLLNPNYYSNYYVSDETAPEPPTSLNDVYATPLHSDYRIRTKIIGGGLLNIKKLQTVIPVMDLSGDTMIITPTYNAGTGVYTYPVQTLDWAKYTYLPALQKTLADTLDLAPTWCVYRMQDYGYKVPVMNAKWTIVISQQARFCIKNIIIGKKISLGEYLLFLEEIRSHSFWDINSTEEES